MEMETSGGHCKLCAVVFYYLFMCEPVLYACVCVCAVVCLARTCVCADAFPGRTVLPYSPETGLSLNLEFNIFQLGWWPASCTSLPRGGHRCAWRNNPAVYVRAEDQNSGPHSCTAGTLAHRATSPGPMVFNQRKENRTNRLASCRFRTPCVSATACGPAAFVRFSSCRIHMMRPLPIFPAGLPRLAVSNYSSQHCIVSILGHNFTRV